MTDKEEKTLDRLAISEYDERFNQLKQELAEKDGTFRELYTITDGRRYSKRMRGAFKIIERASKKLNGARNPVRKLIRLFLYEAALRTYDYWKTHNIMIAEKAKVCVKEYQIAKELPDLLDENFFKGALRAVRNDKY